jgi:predicted dehydrogenase
MKSIAVIGLGSISNRHRENIRLKFPLACIYALSSSGRKIDEKVTNCDVVCETIEELLCIDLDFVVVASPASHHALHSLPFIKKSIPVLIEKPLCIDSKTANELIMAQKSSGGIVCVAYCLRYLESLIQLKSMIDNNELGRIYQVSVHVGQNLNDWRPDVALENTVSANRKLGGGVLNELSHEIDYMMWIFGHLTQHGAILSHTNSFNIDVEDIADVLLSNSQGISFQLHLDFIQKKAQRYCQILCEKGRIDVNLIDDTITLTNKESITYLLEDRVVSANDKYIDMLDDFIINISGQSHTCISLDQGVNTVMMIESIRNNAKVCVQ